MLNEYIVVVVPPVTVEKIREIERLGGRVKSIGKILPYMVVLIDRRYVPELAKLPWVVSVQENIRFTAQSLDYFFRENKP